VASFQVSRFPLTFDKQPVDDATKAYVRNRLINPSLNDIDERALCTTLCISSGISFIDAYEAHVETLQFVLNRSDLDAALRAANDSLKELNVQPTDWPKSDR